MRILNLILIALFSSCYWREFKVSQTLSDNLRKTKLNKNYKDAIEREKTDNYSFDNFTKFKKELEELSKWRIAALLEKESEIKKAKESANAIYEKLSWDITKGTCQTGRGMGDEDPVVWTKLLFNENNESVKRLRELHKKENVSFEDFFWPTYSSLDAKAKPLFYVFYLTSCKIITYKNTVEYLVEDSQINMHTLKTNLSKGTRILIYHFPYLFEKLKFLFNREYVFN